MGSHETRPVRAEIEHIAHVAVACRVIKYIQIRVLGYHRFDTPVRRMGIGFQGLYARDDITLEERET